MSQMVYVLKFMKKKIGVMALNKEVSISPFLSEVQYVVQCQGQYLFG